MKVFVRTFILVLLTVSPLNANVVKVIKGKVIYEEGEKKEAFGKGEKIEIGEGKFCTQKEDAVLILPDDSEVTLKPQTCISLEDLEEKPAIFLFFGRIINKVTKALGLSQRYEVHTLNAVAGVRGTVFSATAGEDGAVVFELEEGEIEVESGDTSLLMKPGESVEVVEEGKIRKRKRFRGKEEWFKWIRERRVTREILKRKVAEAKRRFKRHIKELKDLLGKYRKEKNEVTALQIGRTLRKLRRDMVVLRGAVKIARPHHIENVITPSEVNKLRNALNKLRMEKRDLLKEIRHTLMRKRAMEIWKGLPEKERRILLKRYRTWKKLPPSNRAEIINRWRRWKSLPPEKRREIIENYKRWKKLTPAQRQKILRAYERWKHMPPERRKKIMENYRKFKKLPPEVRRKLLRRFWRKRK